VPQFRKTAPAVRLCLLVNTVGCDAGAERQVAETASHLDSHRFDIHVCCFEDSPRLHQLASHCHTRVFPVRSIYTLNGLFQLWRFRRYLAHFDIQIVHAYMEKANIFGSLAALGTKHHVLVTSRLNIGDWYTPFYKRVFRYLDRYTTRVLANSEGVKQVTLEAERLAPEKVDVIYQGVDMVRYGPDAGDPNVAGLIGIPTGSQVVGIVANFRPIKDLELFLRAASIVAKNIPNAVFLLVGNGPLRQELGRLAAEIGISEKVFFSDGRGTVADYLRCMSIGCLCSKGEGFSNAILEYMAAALPVVASDVGGNREAIADGETGFIVRDRTPQAFAEAVTRLLRDPLLRASMGRRGMQRCRELFEIGLTIRRLEKYYDSLLPQSQLTAPSKPHGKVDPNAIRS
jgi:glycosyltransferase involved in cell wall biosynthesis